MTRIVAPSDGVVYQVKPPQIKLAQEATAVITFVDTLENARSAFALIEGKMPHSRGSTMKYKGLNVSITATRFYGTNTTHYQAPLAARISVEREPQKAGDWLMLEELTDKLAAALVQTKSGFAIWTPSGKELYRSETLKLRL